MLNWLNMLFGTDISWHGWIAITAGIIGVAGLNVGLMLLTIFSNRKGYDAAANDYVHDHTTVPKD
ncbi:MAG: hypothetical protein RIM72_07120 [Alphaproteobacteria bacterium]